MPLIDKYGRNVHDLRISITDRCNYRCVYCRSGNNGPSFPEMSIADYLRMVRVFVGLGITKVRLTGGEPLLRKGLVDLVGELGRMQTVAGKQLDIAITTNGHLLAELAQPLADAGLSRVTVSMDAVEPQHFARITRVPNGYERVLAGIRAAQKAGLNPVKVNCVLLRGFNDDQVVGFGKFAREEGVVSASLSSCRWKKTACGRPRLWSRLTKSCAAWRSSCRCARSRTRAARRQGVTFLKTASERSES